MSEFVQRLRRAASGRLMYMAFLELTRSRCVCVVKEAVLLPQLGIVCCMMLAANRADDIRREEGTAEDNHRGGGDFFDYCKRCFFKWNPKST